MEVSKREKQMEKMHTVTASKRQVRKNSNNSEPCKADGPEMVGHGLLLLAMWGGLRDGRQPR
jgi:hypothetical protein